MQQPKIFKKMIIQDKAYPVSPEKSSTWAYYGAIFIVLVGSSVLLLYNMLPKGSIERALKGDLGCVSLENLNPNPKP
jgi:hypothetical protein